MTIGSAVAWYKIVEKSRERLELSFQKQPQVKRDLTRFEEQSPKITSVDALLKDRRTLQVVLSAFQLESEIDKRAMIKKVLTESISNEKSFANRMIDPRWRQLAQALQPAFEKGIGLGDQKAVDTILNGYKTNEFEKAQGKQNDGMREVLYFKRKIGSVNSLAEIMADKSLMKVVRVGLGFPKAFGALEYEQQKSRLEKRVKVDEFKDPKFVEKFVQRFLIMNEQEKNAGNVSAPVLSLFQPAPRDGGFQPIGIDFLI